MEAAETAPGREGGAAHWHPASGELTGRVISPPFMGKHSSLTETLGISWGLTWMGSRWPPLADSTPSLHPSSLPPPFLLVGLGERAGLTL